MVAAADGTVVKNSGAWPLGNHVELEHAGGYSTIYAHLNERSEHSVGTELLRGQKLGDSGWTGKSISAADSAGYVIERISLLDASARGRLMTYDGKIIPW